MELSNSAIALRRVPVSLPRAVSGVGGIESEAVMLGQPISLTLPQVVGCRLVGSVNILATSIDIVLGITKVGYS